MPDFVHLHCHTQYSLLDGASDIEKMMLKAAESEMKGVALTDHGNMFGAFKFVAEAEKHNLKPMVGCEFYLVEDRHKRVFSNARGEKDNRYHQLLLAKNKQGYENLSKLCSLGFIEGLYGKFPRIDKELLLQYHEGIIATSCCIGAEIPQAIIHGDLEKAENLIKWWVDLLGDDFYIEIQRHAGLENIDGLGISQEDVNQHLIRFAKKYNLRVIATNDSHYINEEDAATHDILLCVNTGVKITDENRFRFSSNEYFFKTKEEMAARFSDIPEALDNTLHVFDKIDTLKLKRDILLPKFPIPPGFDSPTTYLRHLVYEGALHRYGELTAQVTERLDFELKIISDMGFEGYFLVVQDFIKAARKLGVAVGPGRGSAAGSAVAYCLTITNIDPIRYRLLFERFLNPERISMPDIDIDFDDFGREKVINYVVDKYGKNQVAQIITFGTMAAKSAIRDVARVLDLPLSDSDRIAKYLPNKPGFKFKHILGKSLKEISDAFNSDDVANILKFNEISEQEKQGLETETVKRAIQLEGNIRNSGIHAAGIIIAPDDITKYIPVCTAKDSDLLVTQFDGSVVESAGMLKMDFLGLKTLSIIADAITNITDRYGKDKHIDPDDIPLDDAATYELFQRGDTIGIFQFESDGMRKHLKDLKPTNIEDLIAMNALFRPGPMDNIPSFINRKHGREKIEYPHEWLEDMLKPTYGIMVYQEQIMECARIMADFSLGKADSLRRAMGKKKAHEMEKNRKEFIEGAAKKNIPEEKSGEIFDIMEKFAQYGFNRSHAAAYSVLAFQTAYLKAHYPAEFLASVLTHNKNNLETVNFFLKECKRLGIEVLGPDINESKQDFTVNAAGQIRFGLAALKGVGEGPVAEILREREENGPFKDIFDMVERLNLRNINKKCLESLVLGGGFDCFTDIDRPQYFASSGKYESFLEAIVKYGNTYKEQQQSKVVSLFAEMEENFISKPEIPEAEAWPLIEKLEKEREMTGIYISGHPLDDFKAEVENFTNTSLANIEGKNIPKIKFAAIVTAASFGTDKKGYQMGNFVLQDYTGSFNLRLFSGDFEKFGQYFKYGNVVFVEGHWKARFKGDGQIFNLTNVSMLSDVAGNMTETITIRLDTSQINAEQIVKLDKIFSRKTGKQKLRFTLHNPLENISLQMSSTERKVTIDTHFLSELDKLGYEFSLS